MAIDVLLLLCGIFYAVLCVFSIVTGLMYAGGKKKLNPLELSDKFMSRYTDPDRLKRFTIKMGWVTFLVGIVQGITSFAILHRHSAVFYWIYAVFHSLCCMEAEGEDQRFSCSEMYRIHSDFNCASTRWSASSVLWINRE